MIMLRSVFLSVLYLYLGHHFHSKKINFMLDELMNIIKANGQNTVVQNSQVPNEHNDAVLQSAGGSIMDTIKGMIASGQGDQVTQLSENPGHPAAQQMQQNFADNIMQKFGINGGAAKDIAASLIPSVLAQLKGADSGSGGFNLSSISSMLGKTGLDKDGDGDVDLKDVTKMFGF